MAAVASYFEYAVNTVNTVNAAMIDSNNRLEIGA